MTLIAVVREGMGEAMRQQSFDAATRLAEQTRQMNEMANMARQADLAAARMAEINAARLNNPVTLDPIVITDTNSTPLTTQLVNVPIVTGGNLAPLDTNQQIMLITDPYRNAQINASIVGDINRATSLEDSVAGIESNPLIQQLRDGEITVEDITGETSAEGADIEATPMSLADVFKTPLDGQGINQQDSSHSIEYLPDSFENSDATLITYNINGNYVTEDEYKSVYSPEGVPKFPQAEIDERFPVKEQEEFDYSRDPHVYYVPNEGIRDQFNDTNQTVFYDINQTNADFDNNITTPFTSNLDPADYDLDMSRDSVLDDYTGSDYNFTMPMPDFSDISLRDQMIETIRSFEDDNSSRPKEPIISNKVKNAVKGLVPMLKEAASGDIIGVLKEGKKLIKGEQDKEKKAKESDTPTKTPEEIKAEKDEADYQKALDILGAPDRASTLSQALADNGIMIDPRAVLKGDVAFSEEEFFALHKVIQEKKRQNGEFMQSWEDFYESMSEVGKLEEYVHEDVSFDTTGNLEEIIDPIRQKVMFAKMMGKNLLVVSDEEYDRMMSENPDYADTAYLSETDFMKYAGADQYFDGDAEPSQGTEPEKEGYTRSYDVLKAIRDGTYVHPDLEYGPESKEDPFYSISIPNVDTSGPSDVSNILLPPAAVITAQDIKPSDRIDQYWESRGMTEDDFGNPLYIEIDGQRVRNPNFAAPINANDLAHLYDFDVNDPEHIQKLFDPQSMNPVEEMLFPQGTNPIPLNVYKPNEDASSGMVDRYGADMRFKDTNKERFDRYYRSLPVSSYSSYGEPAGARKAGNFISPFMDKLGDPFSIVGDSVGYVFDTAAKPFNALGEKLGGAGFIPNLVGAGLSGAGNFVSSLGQRADDFIGNTIPDFFFQDVPQTFRGAYQMYQGDPAGRINLRQGATGMLDGLGQTAMVPIGAGMDGVRTVAQPFIQPKSDNPLSNMSSPTPSTKVSPLTEIMRDKYFPRDGGSSSGSSYIPTGDWVIDDGMMRNPSAYNSQDGANSSSGRRGATFGGVADRLSDKYSKNGINLNSPDGRAAFESAYGKEALDDALREVGLGHLAGTGSAVEGEEPDLFKVVDKESNLRTPYGGKTLPSPVDKLGETIAAAVKDDDEEDGAFKAL